MKAEIRTLSSNEFQDRGRFPNADNINYGLKEAVPSLVRIAEADSGNCVCAFKGMCGLSLLYTAGFMYVAQSTFLLSMVSRGFGDRDSRLVK